MGIMMSDNVKGAVFGILSAVCYGLNPLFGLPLYRMGFSTPSVLFYRFLFAILMLTAVMMVNKKTFRLPGTHLLPMAVAGILLAGSCLSLFLAFRFMDAGIASTIIFVYPAMVAVIMWLCFKEKLSVFTLVCIVAALSGVGILSGGGGNVSVMGVACVLISALTYAVYIVMLRKSRLRLMESETVTLYALICGLPLFFILTGCGAELNLLTRWQEWGAAAGLALFTAFFSFLFMAKAVRYIGATKTAVLGAMEPTTALLIGVMVFGEKLTFAMGCGCVLIIAAIIAIVCKKE